MSANVQARITAAHFMGARPHVSKPSMRPGTVHDPSGDVYFAACTN